MTIKNMKRWHLAAGVLGAALCLVAGGFYWQGHVVGAIANAASDKLDQGKKGAGAGAGRPVPVVVTAAATQDVRVTQNALGTVTAQASVTVRARVGGQLQKVLFKEGQFVKAGELLAEIDPRPFAAQLAQAEGQLKRDLALLKNAQSDLARYQVLRKQESISEQQLDNQVALVQQYQGAVQADQGLVDNARLQLGFTRIAAPVSGRIGMRLVDAGNIVSPSDAAGLAVITAVQPINAVFSLPEDLLPNVASRHAAAQKAGRSLAVEAWDRGNRKLIAKGQLLTIDNQIDAATGTVKFKAVFPNNDEALYPNQFVNLRLLVETRPASVVAPSAAIQRGNQGAFVYVVGEDKTVKTRPVKLGPADADKVAILEGLAAGEQVVVTGIDRLRDGAKVAVSTKQPSGESRTALDERRPERQGKPG